MSQPPIHVERLVPGSIEWQRHGVQHLQRYRFALAAVHRKRVLDLACGVGFGSYVLARNGAAEVCGIDLDQEAIRYAEQNFSVPNLSFARADGMQFRADRPFDVIVSFETIEHVPDPAALVESFDRNLADGGTLVLSAPNRLRHSGAEDPSENPFHLHEPTCEELMKWLEPRFVISEMWEQSPVNADSTVNAEFSHRCASSLFLHGLLKAEDLVRKWLGKPWPAQRGERLEKRTEITPLLPTRFAAAEVFLFVCHKRPGTSP